MISLGIKSDLDKITKGFDDMTKSQIPFATSLALNRMASMARDTIKTNMKVIFDRPAPFTLNSLWIKNATKTNLVARVEHKDFAGKGTPASKYLRPEIEGGTRTQKRSERVLAEMAGMPNGYWVPGPNVKLDAYGNVPGSVITQILSAVGGLSEVGFKGNRTARSAQRQGAKLKTFVVIPQGNPRGIKPGVYQRVGDKVSIRGRRGNKTATQSGGKLVPILFIVPRVTYQPRYDMAGIVGRVVNAEYSRQFAAALDYALSTARVKVR